MFEPKYFVMYQGKSVSVSQIARTEKVHRQTLINALKRGESIEEAVHRLKTKTPRKSHQFDVGGIQMTAYAIARLSGANRRSMEYRLHTKGLTVQQAVNACGRISYKQMLERLA